MVIICKHKHAIKPCFAFFGFPVFSNNPQGHKALAIIYETLELIPAFNIEDLHNVDLKIKLNPSTSTFPLARKNFQICERTEQLFPKKI